MCGRFTLRTPAHRLAAAFGVDALPNLAPRYNIAPTQEIVAIRMTPAGRRLVRLRWGLIPHWARDPAIGARLINARAETVAEKPSFRDAFRHRRCLIAADGFYEWQNCEAGPKQPYFIHLEKDPPFAFAGLWERWRGDGETVETASIITTEASAALRPIHGRMPVILPPAAHDAWLGETPAERSKTLLIPYAGADLRADPVARHVNNARHDDPDCLAPPAPE